jgi:hypothetical protein
MHVTVCSDGHYLVQIDHALWNQLGSPTHFHFDLEPNGSITLTPDTNGYIVFHTNPPSLLVGKYTAERLGLWPGQLQATISDGVLTCAITSIA